MKIGPSEHVGVTNVVLQYRVSVGGVNEDAVTTEYFVQNVEGSRATRIHSFRTKSTKSNSG